MLKPCQSALVFSVASLAILLAASEAFSQGTRGRAPRRYRGASSEPFVSPYMRLLQPGADPAFNYGTLVQPQVQQEQFNFQQSQQMFRFGRQLQRTQEEVMTPYGPRNTMRPTGGVATRMNYSHFYPSKGGGGAAGGGRKYTGGAGGGMGGGMGMGGMGMGGMGMY